MDRTVKGFLAGAIGAVPMNIINLTLYKMKLSTLRFIDWASLILSRRLPDDLNSTIFYLFIQITWSGVLGIGLAFLLPHVSSKGYVFNATVYTFFMAFTFRVIAVLFQISEIASMPTSSIEMNLLATLSWGLAVAFVLQKREKIKN